MIHISRILLAAFYLFNVLPSVAQPTGSSPGNDGGHTRSWLAGDHHIHSRYSVRWDRSTDPPSPIVGGDAIYPTPMNALMAKHYGLSWMVTTDHGGPNHSKVNQEMAYPELLRSRIVVPEVLQFYGMEFDTPGADHSSFIIPHSDDESKVLYDLEHLYSSLEAYPRDSTRSTEEKMIEALEFARELPLPPVHITHHPSRSAKGLGIYGRTEPSELRNWNDTAPDVSVGMEGAPGHQARMINRDGSMNAEGWRGGYTNYPTMGGFDQMTARLGGLWDSMLGEGRRWWITATSDAHVNWRDGGHEFWPGEYSKTYIFAEKSYEDVLDGIRHGRIFVTTGDLISELFVTATSSRKEASIGGSLTALGEADVTVTIRLRDPELANYHNDNPKVRRVDLILGEVSGPVADRSQDTNSSTRVIKHFAADDWTKDDEYLTMTYTIQNVHRSSYIRVRGTNTAELEPQVDPPGEDPWTDLWFYSNPIFIEIR